jgi:hypothetical protein
MLHDKMIAAIRTGCAAGGAYVLTWLVSVLAGRGIVVALEPEWVTALSGFLFVLFVAAYNLVVNWLTENVWDGFGWLLGVNKPPAYVDVDTRRSSSGGVAVDTGVPNAALE